MESLVQQLVMTKIIDRIEPAVDKPKRGCHKCGIEGIHACPGRPLDPWPPEKVEELKQALSKVRNPIPEVARGQEEKAKAEQGVHIREG